MFLFISYSHLDRDLILQFVEILRAAGHQPWFDDDLLAGMSWKQQLRERINEADAFVYAMTPESIASEWCQWEYATAIQSQKSLLPVLLRKADLPVMLAEIHYVDLTDGLRVTQTIKLLRDLNQLMIRIEQDAGPTPPDDPAGVPAHALVPGNVDLGTAVIGGMAGGVVGASLTKKADSIADRARDLLRSRNQSKPSEERETTTTTETSTSETSAIGAAGIADQALPTDENDDEHDDHVTDENIVNDEIEDDEDDNIADKDEDENDDHEDDDDDEDDEDLDRGGIWG